MDFKDIKLEIYESERNGDITPAEKAYLLEYVNQLEDDYVQEGVKKDAKELDKAIDKIEKDLKKKLDVLNVKIGRKKLELKNTEAEDEKAKVSPKHDKKYQSIADDIKKLEKEMEDLKSEAKKQTDEYRLTKSQITGVNYTLATESTALEFVNDIITIYEAADNNVITKEEKYSLIDDYMGTLHN